ncbi:MAG: DUF2254 domain-containing protein [Leeuwenhoekiella sp.]
MNKLLLRLKSVYTNITENIAFFPSLLALSGLVLSFIMLYAEEKGISKFLLENASYLVINDANTARTLLSTFIGGIISLMVFSFSMVMILLNQAASNYSPRILPGLISNKKHQLVLGFYIATLIYCIMILLSVKPTNDKTQLPGFAVLIGIILSMHVLVFFIYFIHSISEAIQINNIIEQIYLESKNRLSKLIDHTDADKSNGQFPDTEKWQTYSIDQTGYLQTFLIDTLMSICDSQQCKVQIIVAKGMFLLQGVPVIKVSKELDEDSVDAVMHCFRFSQSEIVSQNYILGFKQLTEIGLKAMSPGINDPGTAITCLDYLTELFALRLCKQDESFIKNAEGEEIIKLRTINFSEVFYHTLAAFREYCRHDMHMMQKMLMAINNLQFAKSVISGSDEILIEQANLILTDAKKSITNRTDLKNLFRFAERIRKQNNTDIALLTLDE